MDAFRDSGVPVREFIVAGGLLKNKLLMQIYADVTGLPLSTIGSAQGPALGSAIHAAVAAGEVPGHPGRRGCHGIASPAAVYTPIPDNVAAYEELFREYRTLHDYFGRGANERHAPAQGHPDARPAAAQLRQDASPAREEPTA